MKIIKITTIVIACIGCFIPIFAQNESVLIPQTGYKTTLNKIAVVRAIADSFTVTDVNDQIVLKGKLTAPAVWPFSDEKVSKADLSEIRIPGDYNLMIKGSSEKTPFGIYAHTYSDIADAAVRALFYNRCSYSISPEFGGKWARKAGHPDTKVYIHKSAVSEGRPEGFVVSSPGGWYDAGDYNKYIVNSSISTYTMLLAYNIYPEFWNKRHLNIPESGNNVPDELDETLFNLRWMLTMQDNDGGVYHKCTTLAFEGFIMPEEAVEKRYMIQKNTAATLDFAATMAYASRVLSKFPKALPGLADSCKQAAIKAWEWSKIHPSILYHQPADVSTGAYGDRDIRDEWFWAGVEMSILTGKDFPDSLLQVLQFKTPSWASVATLGIISAITNKDKMSAAQFNSCSKVFFDYTDKLVTISENAAYPVSIDYFAWGSNSDVANQGLLKMIAYSIKPDSRYLQSATNDMNYLTGVNPTGYCYITGFGKKSSRNIHHRPSASDKILDPVPGFLAGGPNTVVFIDCPDAKRSKLPALSYVDEVCSYSTNEIAINWNAPLVFLAGALSAVK
jgi:endoglucanase